jgi:GNAT superfamily N-acetyltransferase
MLQHETWPIDKLIEYARNPRKNDHAVDRVAAAIREFGFRVPVVAKSDGTVVDGHLRLKAAKKLGLTEVPVVLADDMTDLQIKAFRLSVSMRACRMVVMPEWQGAGVGMRFLNATCEAWLCGENRYKKNLRTLFHTSHPGLCAALRRDQRWRQISSIFGDANNKGKSKESIIKSGSVASAGYGGHMRAVQGFRYYGQAGIDAAKGKK